MNVLIIVGICVVLGILGQLSMKKGMNEVGQIGIKDIFSKKLFSIVFQKYVFIGICFYVLGNMFWLIALSMAELSYVYPLIGTGYLITAILSWLFFGESMTFMKILGIILISLGAYLIVIKV
ncbi:MAG: EamA family transporter [Candidatus Aenigmatarchaeota archaeon]